MQWQDQLAETQAAAAQPSESTAPADQGALAVLRTELEAACSERDHARQQLSRFIDPRRGLVTMHASVASERYFNHAQSKKYCYL